MTVWQTTRFAIDLTRPRVMAIVNLTPDSFSDGGRLTTTGLALQHCERLLTEGADILDIGGESTRPGAVPVPADEEWRRVEPVLRAALALGCPLSLDSMKTEVMRQALDLGIDIVNDVNALRAPGAAAAVAASRAGICLMHLPGQPRTVHHGPSHHVDVVADVAGFLDERANALKALGVEPTRIVVDPGIGFGKSVAQNFELLARQRELLGLGYPLLAGWSRKGSLGHITGKGVGDRLAASIAAALAAVLNGASIVRVHDVAATVDALKVWQAAGLPAPR